MDLSGEAGGTWRLIIINHAPSKADGIAENATTPNASLAVFALDSSMKNPLR